MRTSFANVSSSAFNCYRPCRTVLLPAGTEPGRHKNVGELCDVRPDDVKPMVAGFGLAQARVTRWWRMKR
jgi:hypothetical protein